MIWSWRSFSDLSTVELYDIMALRQAVFVVEQECAYQDSDGQDGRSMHLSGMQDGRLRAYLRAFGPGLVYEEAAIGRVVVASTERGTGLGRRLMEEGLVRVNQTWGPVAVKVSAQAHLERFYRSLGFEVVGEGYLEDGIEHLPMTRPARS
ncbi:MAG: GNAT family N-acetyltransferase [Myxococcota bacterium]|nr:GNAT family N-acetyltransferase [Myxococcota bacterium]